MDDGSQWAAPRPEGQASPGQPDSASGEGSPPQGAAPHHQDGHGAAPYGHSPYGQPAYGRPADGQAPYAQAPYGQGSYGPPAHGQAPYGHATHAQVPYGPGPYSGPGYGQAPYGPPGYGPPGYPPAGYGPPGYAPPGYGPPGYGGWAPEPRRPTVATSAGVLGIVTGALTAIGSLIMLIAAASGADDPATTVLVLGLPCAIGLLVGGLRLLQRHRSGLLFGSALAALGVLALALVMGLLTLDEGDVIGLSAFLLFASVLPIITAVFARLPEVTRWVDG